MKKDFTQPFKQSPLLYASIFPVIDGNSLNLSGDLYVLTQEDRQLPNLEYAPLRVDIDINKEPVLQITKFLYDHGLVLTSLRQLLTDISVGFTFVDDTPGQLETSTCYRAQVDVIEKKSDLVYVPHNLFADYIRHSSLLEEGELAAAQLLTKL